MLDLKDVDKVLNELYHLKDDEIRNILIDTRLFYDCEIDDIMKYKKKLSNDAFIEYTGVLIRIHIENNMTAY